MLIIACPERLVAFNAAPPKDKVRNSILYTFERFKILTTSSSKYINQTCERLKLNEPCPEYDGVVWGLPDHCRGHKQ